MNRSRLVLVVLTAVAWAGAHATAQGPGGVVFRHPLDNAPIDVSLKPNEPATESVRRFHATGENPYAGQPEALAAGKQLYETWCQPCHLPDGSGRIGPSLVDQNFAYPRTKTDVGLFEIVYAGGSGAMQPFRDRMTQDEILKLLAYVRSLKR